MDKHYYRLSYRLGDQDGYLIWYTGEEEGVLVEADGRVPSFPSIEALTAYAQGKGIELVDEWPVEHDLDCTASWLAASGQGAVDCENLLSAWNLFEEVSASIGGDFDADQEQTDSLYDKLFQGSDTANNVLRQEGEPAYRPEWSKEELALLRTTLGKGLALFERVLHRIQD